MLAARISSQAVVCHPVSTGDAPSSRDFVPTTSGWGAGGAPPSSIACTASVGGVAQAASRRGGSAPARVRPPARAPRASPAPGCPRRDRSGPRPWPVRRPSAAAARPISIASSPVTYPARGARTISRPGASASRDGSSTTARVAALARHHPAEPLEAGARRQRLPHLPLGVARPSRPGRPSGPSAPRGAPTAPSGRAAPARGASRSTRRPRARCPPPARGARPSASAAPRSARRRAARPAPSTAPAARRRSRVFMNAPRPTLTSSTRPSIPSASFLLMIDAVMSGMLSTVAVTSRSRYEPAVRRRDVPGLADDDAADIRAARRRSRGPRDRPGSPGSPRACRACRRCGPARAPTSSARPRRTRPPAGARTSDVLSPTPPVLCLSTFRPASRLQVEPGAGVGHGLGQPGRFLVAHPPQDDRHQQGRDLVVGPRPVRGAGDEMVDLGPVQGLAVAFLPDDVDRTHGSQKYSSPCRKSRRQLPIKSHEQPARGGPARRLLMMGLTATDRADRRIEPMPADLAARVTAFARACKAAARSVALYPGEHPAVAAALEAVTAAAEARRRARAAPAGRAAGRTDGGRPGHGPARTPRSRISPPSSIATRSAS